MRKRNEITCFNNFKLRAEGEWNISFQDLIQTTCGGRADYQLSRTISNLRRKRSKVIVRWQFQDLVLKGNGAPRVENSKPCAEKEQTTSDLGRKRINVSSMKILKLGRKRRGISSFEHFKSCAEEKRSYELIRNSKPHAKEGRSINS